MTMSDEEEIKRLRYLDQQHRRISEDAEAETRDLKNVVRGRAKEVKRLCQRIRDSRDSDAVLRKETWDRITELLDSMSHL